MARTCLTDHGAGGRATNKNRRDRGLRQGIEKREGTNVYVLRSCMILTFDGQKEDGGVKAAQEKASAKVRPSLGKKVFRLMVHPHGTDH